jgi:Mg2+/citrate symporter
MIKIVPAAWLVAQAGIAQVGQAVGAEAPQWWTPLVNAGISGAVILFFMWWAAKKDEERNKKDDDRNQVDREHIAAINNLTMGMMAAMLAMKTLDDHTKELAQQVKERAAAATTQH